MNPMDLDIFTFLETFGCGIEKAVDEARGCRSAVTLERLGGNGMESRNTGPKQPSTLVNDVTHVISRGCGLGDTTKAMTHFPGKLVGRNNSLNNAFLEVDFTLGASETGAIDLLTDTKDFHG
jgi:hypothetical protein